MREPPLEDDRKLARRLAAGDEDAFNGFFDEYFPRLYRFALARVGPDVSIVDDVVQESLMAAMSQIHRYRGEARLFSWLCTICGRKLARRESAERRLGERSIPIEGAFEVDGAIASLGDPRPLPEERVEADELRRLVHAALDSLPERYARALTWKYLEDRRVDEVSELLDISPKAAESVLTRARLAFRDAMRSLLDDRRGVAGARR